MAALFYTLSSQQTRLNKGSTIIMEDETGPVSATFSLFKTKRCFHISWLLSKTLVLTVAVNIVRL